MEALTLEAFERASDEFDLAVRQSRDIDLFCSASDWIIPAHHAFSPRREPWLWRGDAGFAAFMCATESSGARVLQPLEPAWGFACPIIGAEPALIARDVVATFAAQPELDAMLITGLVEESRLTRALVSELARHCRLFRGESTRRFRASLAGGLEGFLSRRSGNFRRSVTRAERAAHAAGIELEHVAVHDEAQAEALYDRILEVERRSWKGREGSGITEEPMRGFYGRMLPRLIRRGALRLIFARHEERDVAYILGGVFAGTYRGLQFSFDADYAHYGLGNVAQLEQLRALSGEGIELYDLGSDVTYKARWGEQCLETVMLIAAR